MTTQLRSCLLGLVILNLVFVQVTGAVSLNWMLPLFVLAILAPTLAPLQDRRLYRLAWNVALMAIFGLLLAHVRQAGVLFMLEDGLLLAAFCQVHVLNNLAKQKRPDLIFFNSFLIALVTGFFCQDLVYSLVFGAYALMLTIAICIATANTVGSEPKRVLRADELWPLVRRGAKMGLQAMVVTAIVFAFWPRDFDREGLVETQIASATAGTQIGFATQVRLDHKGPVVRSNRIIIRAKLLRGSRAHVSEYWRGATFTNLQQQGWWADTNPQGQGYSSTRQLDELWQRRSAGEFVRSGHRFGARVSVELSTPRPQALFAPLGIHRMKFDGTAWPLLDGIFSVTAWNSRKIRYTMDLNHRREPPPPVSAGFMRDLLRLRAAAVPPETARLQAAIGKQIPEGANQQVTAEVIRNYLSRHREYFLPGESGAAPNLRAFIAGDGGGHCEFFATTMVILLRQQRIPCRMVGGYHAHEWNPAGDELTIRSNHAHAWVEMWDPAGGWATIDPTPLRAEFGNREDSLLSAAGNFFRGLWASVATFNGNDRDAVLGWAKARAIALYNTVVANPIGLLVGVVVLWLARRWWRARRHPRLAIAVDDYLRVLQRLGLEAQPGETPRQLLARARSGDLTEDRIQSLVAATSTHEAARYG